MRNNTTEVTKNETEKTVRAVLSQRGSAAETHSPGRPRRVEKPPGKSRRDH